MNGSSRMRLALLAGLAACCVLSGTAGGDLIVGGLISSDTRWTISGSPYVAPSGVRITGGATLEIDPGVVVRFGDEAKLVVEAGVLSARGTGGNPITFTADADGWGSVQFADGSVDASFDSDGDYVGGSILEHVVMTGAGSGAGLNAAVQVVSASPYIARCTIRDNTGTGIHAHLADGLRIDGNTITNNVSSSWGGGLYLTFSNDVSLSSNSITGNSAGSHGAGVYLDNTDNLTFSGDSITGNVGSVYPAVGVYVGKGDGVKLSVDPANPTEIFGHDDDGYEVVNGNPCEDPPPPLDPNAPENVDGRYVRWAPRGEPPLTPPEIEERIYHYFDDPSRGIVYIPEPAALVLICGLAAPALLKRRRRR